MPVFDAFRQDLRYTVRGLRAKPGFTIAVVLTLALGIGANAAMFGIVDRMLFRPPPMLKDPGTAHRVYFYQTNRGQERASGGYQYARYRDLAANTTSFASSAGYTQRDLAVGIGDAAREMSIGCVSASFFGFFNAPPVLGRYFTSAEDAVPEGAAVVVLSHAFWSTRFGERRDAIGSKIQIGPVVYTVIGVAPAGFAGLWPDQPPVAYIPITTYGAVQARDFTWLKSGTTWYSTYSWGWMSMIVRRKPGVSVERANADLANAAVRSYQSQLVEQKRSTPLTLAKPHAIAASILSERGPSESAVAKVATWVGGVSIVVLLIACANVANLLLARALRRRREVAVRLALGVSRGRLLSQLLTESIVIALAGGAAGLVVAQWGGSALRAALLTKSEPTTVFRDPRTVLFAGAAALVVGLLTGLAPILQTSRANASLIADLKSGTREGTLSGSNTRAVLLVIQAALSVVLLVGAGLFVRSLTNVRNVRLGYDVNPVMLVDLNMRGIKLDSAHTAQLEQRLLASAKHYTRCHPRQPQRGHSLLEPVEHRPLGAGDRHGEPARPVQPQQREPGLFRYLRHARDPRARLHQRRFAIQRARGGGEQGHGENPLARPRRAGPVHAGESRYDALHHGGRHRRGHPPAKHCQRLGDVHVLPARVAVSRGIQA